VPDRFLPTRPDPEGRPFDVVLVTGDAYVDHPAFGAAMIGRYLESLGYRVAILAQPEWKSADAFKSLGKPRLFFGVTAGNLDSMVANYTPDRRRRETDDYSPGGAPGLRPDLASLVYAQRCREAFPDVPVVLGGIEASLRRFSHYDFVQQKVRGSLLADAKADFLVFGMGERAVAELAAGFARKAPVEELQRIRGVAYLTSAEPPEGTLRFPSAEAVASDFDAFHAFSRDLHRALAEPDVPAMAEPHGTRWVVANPPALPLSPQELDALYRLPFARAYPEAYEEMGGVPALAPVKFSLVTHRGCYGGCTFCALTAHQGRAVRSRTPAGLAEEAKTLAARDDFTGTLQDVGGPTANMYGTFCKKAGPGRLGCARQSCLFPEVCSHLETSGAPYLEVLRAVRKVTGVKHVFVASGLRHDLLNLPPQRRLFRELMLHHVGGRMKVAPEHVARRPLRLMAKPPLRVWREFNVLFESLKRESEKELFLVPYLIVGHPGTTLEDAFDLARFARDLGHFVEQVQQFTPTPMTPATAMYWTRRDPLTGEAVFVPSGAEAKIQKALVQFANPRSREKLERYFAPLGKLDLLREFYERQKGPLAPRTRARSGFARRSDRAIIQKGDPRKRRRTNG